MRNRALDLERRRLPWAFSERHWCDFSGRSVSSVTMKGRAAAGFGAHGRSAEVQPGRLGRARTRGLLRGTAPEAGVGKCSGALFSVGLLSPLEIPSRCLRISVSSFVIEKTCGGELGIIILPSGFVALATLPGPLPSPVDPSAVPDVTLPQAGCFPGTRDVFGARAAHLATICPRSSAG